MEKERNYVFNTETFYSFWSVLCTSSIKFVVIKEIAEKQALLFGRPVYL